MKKIWKKAHELGYGKYFVKADGIPVTDDHLYVHQLARIPCVDIINYDANTNVLFRLYLAYDKRYDGHIDRNTLKDCTVKTVMECNL